MPAPADPKKPPAPAPTAAAPARTISGELGVTGAMVRYTGPDPKVVCSLLAPPGAADQVLEVVAHVTGDPLSVSLGAGALPALRGAVRTRLDSNLPPGEKAQPMGGAAVFEMDLALSRFHDRAYAVARVGPGVPLGDSDESTQTGLQKAAWKLPRPC
ncbi:MAG TPA: hypothetical protein VIG99_31325 [Myxococcaceae bacterium]|jgi:hypothetical protein